jgi:hypothetical protein
MQLTVIFEEKESKSWKYAVKVGCTDTGLRGVDLIRKFTGVVELSFDKINRYTKELFDYRVKVPLNEEIAREAELFKTTNEVTVKVPSNFINAYVIEDICVNKDSKSGEVESAYIYYRIDEEKLIKAWSEVGFPLSWGIVAEEEEE